MRNLFYFLTMAAVALTLTACPTVDSTGPVISGFTPLQAPFGTTVTITGENFDGATGVTFNGIEAAIDLVTPTEIKVKVPKALLCSGAIGVTVDGKTTTSTALFTYEPTVTVRTLAGSTRGFWDDTDPLSAKFDTPAGVAVEAGGAILYVADTENHLIRIITQE